MFYLVLSGGRRTPVKGHYTSLDAAMTAADGLATQLGITLEVIDADGGKVVYVAYPLNCKSCG